MTIRHQYAIALFKSFASLREMFECITFNLDFKYHCERLKQLNNKPFISFIVSTKNEAKYLPRLLANINYVQSRAKPEEYLKISGHIGLVKNSH